MKGKLATLNIDWLSIMVALSISIIGVLLISSATHANDDLNGLWQKQLIFLLLGAFAMVGVSFFNYRILLKLSMPIYILAVLSLVVVLIMGRVAGGAQSWISLGGFGFQPSEFTKLALIVLIANYFAKLEQKKLRLLDLVMPGALLSLPVLLTAAQPDLGTATTMIPLFIGIALIAGLTWRAILSIVLIFLILMTFVWLFVLQDYQRERIRSFLNPDDDIKKSGYQIRQSLIAIGSGGLVGKGLYLGSQSQLNFVPAQHTDFIFTVLGEELGFIAVAIVLSLYAVLYVRPMFRLGNVLDVAGIYIVVGVVSYMGFQTLVNVMMSIGLFPTTGVPLPLLSYGGSSLMTNLMAIGLISSVFRHHDKNTKVQL